MRLRLPLLVLIVLSLGTGCTTTKTKLVHFDSDPQGAHISLDGHYLGETPFSREVKSWGKAWIIIKAEKRGFVTKQQEIYTKSVPDRMFFTLATVEEQGKESGAATQQMQQQMQGPTIVITPSEKGVTVK